MPESGLKRQKNKQTKIFKIQFRNAKLDFYFNSTFSIKVYTTDYTAIAIYDFI